ncbi:MAG: substrate-binding domain-containing protein [Armatimonadota bacterium]|nr:substrate-binding domain-containing protein [Armatimonadota bacterium]
MARTAGGRGSSELTLEWIRARIVSGEYPPGAFLPSERVLASGLGVARNTVRAALQRLEREGLIRREPGRSALVTPLVGPVMSETFLLLLPTLDETQPSLITPEAMALVGHTLCACAGSGIQFDIQTVPEEGVSGLLQRLQRSRASGVLLVECHYPEVLEVLRTSNVPHVVINQESDLPGPATRVDFWGVGRRAAEYLLGLGHRRLGVLAGPQERYHYARMLAGFRGRCAESEVYLEPGHVAAVESCSETARQAALGMLSQPHRPTALFCARDVRAYGAYLAARELGLQVPDDLSLVGYDDITWPGGGRQFLSTFPEPTRELGAAAIRMLTSWVHTGRVPEDVVICPDLVVRRSTAPPPRSGAEPSMGPAGVRAVRGRRAGAPLSGTCEGRTR